MEVRMLEAWMIFLVDFLEWVAEDSKQHNQKKESLLCTH
jgi:hypothetical protein